MSSSGSMTWVVRFESMSRTMAWIIAVAPCLILAGWCFDLPVLTSVVPGLKAMSPLSAVMFVAVGASILLQGGGVRRGPRRVALFLAWVVMVVGLVQAFHFLLRWDVGIDDVLFQGRLGRDAMSLNSALSFVLIGLAMAIVDRETRPGVRPAELLALFSLMMALMVLVGYFYHVRDIGAGSSFTSMSIPSSLLFILLSITIIFMCPRQGLMRIVSSETGGGAMARRMLPGTTAILCVVGWLRLEGERIGLYCSEFGLVLFLLVSVIVLGALILKNALQLVRADNSQKEVENALRRVHEELEQRVVERTRDLNLVLGELSAGITMLTEVMRDVVGATGQMSSGTSQSAAAVAQTATTVEEVRQTARMTSQDAGQVAASAMQASQISQEGKKTTEDAISTIQRIRQEMDAIADSMMRLNDQTQAIGQIVAAVNALAAQSNLLAVNAAIEAARAGERGKGFAVVAQEVKSLADQSRRATQQIGTILSDIQRATQSAVMATEHGRKSVELGVAQSIQAGGAIETLANSVGLAAEAATHIAGASQQQLVGIDQVSTAMESIKRAIARNVTSSKQLETSARHLRELGTKLEQLVSRYKTKG